MMDPILITGAARSGTSMTAGSIHLCGAWGGNMSGPNSNNKRGMFENSEVRQDIVKPILRGMDCDPMGQKPLPSDEQVRGFGLKQAIKLRERVCTAMKAQGLGEGQRWFYKGAKMCLIWPLWYMAFPNAQWIVVRRDTEDIISSCMDTGFMRAYTTREGWTRWVHAHLNRFDEMEAAPSLSMREIWPTEMVEGKFDNIKVAIQGLGLQWNEKVMSFIDPVLWNTAKGESVNG